MAELPNFVVASLSCPYVQGLVDTMNILIQNAPNLSLKCPSVIEPEGHLKIFMNGILAVGSNVHAFAHKLEREEREGEREESILHITSS